ncbi:MAG: 3'(2'),5'-bisphosphate nucleotidase CysQ [Balneolaceae bacterium]
MNDERMMKEVIEIAREAGKAILAFYQEDIEVSLKEDESPLTKADLAAHRVISRSLSRLTPEIPLLSEEGGIEGYEVRRAWNRYWLVDPLDGTKEFIKKNGEFTVNIALIEHGVPVLGVVHIPAKKLTYTGEKSAGSYRIEEGGEPVRIRSGKPDLEKPLVVITSRSHRSDDLEEKLAELNVQIGQTIPAGSSLKFCLVAEGKADIYPRFGPTMEWDTAAGDAVFRYSGGRGPRKSSLVYNKESLRNEGFIIGL